MEKKTYVQKDRLKKKLNKIELNAIVYLFVH